MFIYKGKLSIELEENVKKLKKEIRTIRKVEANDFKFIYI